MKNADPKLIAKKILLKSKADSAKKRIFAAQVIFFIIAAVNLITLITLVNEYNSFNVIMKMMLEKPVKLFIALFSVIVIVYVTLGIIIRKKTAFAVFTGFGLLIAAYTFMFLYDSELFLTGILLKFFNVLILTISVFSFFHYKILNKQINAMKIETGEIH